MYNYPQIPVTLPILSLWVIPESLPGEEEFELLIPGMEDGIGLNG